MATVTNTIPDDKETLVADAMAARYGWDPDMGLTKKQFLKATLARIMKDAVAWYETEQAAQAAPKTVVTIT